LALSGLVRAVVLRHDEHNLSGLDVPKHDGEPEIPRLDDHGAPVRGRAAPPWWPWRGRFGFGWGGWWGGHR
jgi:hypothetical protein